MWAEMASFVIISTRIPEFEDKSNTIKPLQKAEPYI